MAYTPRPLQDLVGAVFREHRREEHLTLAALQNRWAALVGPGLAERTWPARLQRGLLWVTAPDSSWAYQLQFLKAELLGSLRTGMPNCPVTDLRFKVGALPASVAAAAHAGPPAAPPRSDAPPPHREPLSSGEPPPHREPPQPPAPPEDEPRAADIAPELARAAAAIADPALRSAFVRAMAKQARHRNEKS
jgi:hypothetical protein